MAQTCVILLAFIAGTLAGKWNPFPFLCYGIRIVSGSCSDRCVDLDVSVKVRRRHHILMSSVLGLDRIRSRYEGLV